MKCGINSVRYDATVFSNTAVCQNVNVSYYQYLIVSMLQINMKDSLSF